MSWFAAYVCLMWCALPFHALDTIYVDKYFEIAVAQEGRVAYTPIRARQAPTMCET